MKLISVVASLILCSPLLLDAQELALGPRILPTHLAVGAAPDPCGSPAADTPSIAPPRASSATEYIVGEGDLLKINVWKEPELSLTTVTVRPDGMISMPLIGAVQVAGLSPSQIQDALMAGLTRFLSKPKVTVTVTEIKSKSVYVTGEVTKPGVYPMVGPTGVLQVMVMAGGPTPFAHKKSIFVLRNVDGKEQKIPVNYVRLLHGGEGAQNLELRPGDTIVVP